MTAEEIYKNLAKNIGYVTLRKNKSSKVSILWHVRSSSTLIREGKFLKCSTDLLYSLGLGRWTRAWNTTNGRTHGNEGSEL